MKVLIKAPLSIFTGYGNDGIGLAEAFIRMGADVVLQPTHVQAPLPKEVAELLAKPVEAPFDLTIHHVDPGALNSSDTLKESSGAFIGWSMWEYTNLLNHGKQDTFKEKWKHYDMVIGYDDVSVGAFKEYFDGPTPKLQGGYNPENWPVAERDWFEDNFYFCMLGSLTVRKDPYLAIAAFTQLQNEHEDFKKYARLSLKTTPQNSMPPQIEDVYEGIRIYTDMWQNDLVWKFYESQHVLLAPSRGEGKNVPALEFMTTGGAVIATDWGGHKEWLNPDYSYPLDYTLEVSDYDEPDTECAKASLEHLKEQMLHVFRNRGDAKQKGQLASQIIPRLCAWDSVVDRLMNVLRDEHPNGEELWMKAFVSRQEYGNGTS